MDYATGKELERVNEELSLIWKILQDAKLVKVQKKESVVEKATEVINQKQKIM